MPQWAMRYTAHTGYERPDYRPQFLSTVGPDLAKHVFHAAELGLAGVLYPWALERPPTEVAQVRAALAETGLADSCVLSAPTATLFTRLWTDRSPSARARLEAVIREACEMAVSLRSPTIAAFPTLVAGGEGDETYRDMAVANLSDMASLAADHGLTIGIEPMTVIPGLMFASLAATLDAVRRIGRPNVGVIFDTAHIAKGGDDIMLALEAVRDHLVLLQLVDLPGRVEPGAGTLDLVPVAAAAVRHGYAGLVDLEHGWETLSLDGETTGLARVRHFDAQVRAAVAGEAIDHFTH